MAFWKRGSSPLIHLTEIRGASRRPSSRHPISPVSFAIPLTSSKREQDITPSKATMNSRSGAKQHRPRRRWGAADGTETSRALASGRTSQADEETSQF